MFVCPRDYYADFTETWRCEKRPTNGKNPLTFGGNPLPDTDSGSLFHFYQLRRIRYRILLLPYLFTLRILYGETFQRQNTATYRYSEWRCMSGVLADTALQSGQRTTECQLSYMLLNRVTKYVCPSTSACGVRRRALVLSKRLRAARVTVCEQLRYT